MGYTSGMCVAVYIASDKPLPLIPFDVGKPAFNVSEIGERSATVKQQFTKPHVYYVGSHTGCGCGFQNHSDMYGTDFGTDPEEIVAGRESRQRLAEYLRAALATQESLELFASWEGDEEYEPASRGVIVPEDLVDEHTYFLGQNSEPEFLSIVSIAKPKKSWWKPW
jgi:hypothetical protein